MPRRERDSSFQEAYDEVMEALPTHETMDRLTSFLYLLMRDHLPSGVVTEVAIDAYIGEGPFTLSNGYLAKFAEHLTSKLRAPTQQVVEDDLPRHFVRSRKADCSQEMAPRTRTEEQ